MSKTQTYKGLQLVKQAFILPYKEKHRLHTRAYRAQQKNHCEICGVLIVGVDKKIELRFLKNACIKPYTYELKIDDVRLIQKTLPKDKKILGTFHSHPIGECVPSKGDIKKGFYKGTEMIYDVCGHEVKLWHLKNKSKIQHIKEIPLIIEKRNK